MKIQRNQTNKLKVLHKGILVAGATSILGLVILLVITYNSASVLQTSAKVLPEDLMKDKINNGEVISFFAWDDEPVLKAWIGPMAITHGGNATISADGFDNTSGISAGIGSKGINLVISANETFNSDGIDVSTEFKRIKDETGSFFVRGTTLNFGIKQGYLNASFKTMNEQGQINSHSIATDYLIPSDGFYRNCRFLYNPESGKAEIFVNGMTVHSEIFIPKSKMAWNTTDNIIVGYNLNGGNSGKAIMDNLVVRNTNRISPFSSQLIFFNVEPENGAVKISWITGPNCTEEFFAVDKSMDGKTFEEIGRINAIKNSQSPVVYEMIDTDPKLGNLFYKLIPSGKTNTPRLPITAMKFKPEHLKQVSVSTDNK
ncbi:MAG TPA: hypothetical protein PKH65_03880 [Bacteroidia bacterium]|nr:hypothetical protein [Bacteroidia bacterium]HNT79798.1 hypothetical protein [Bacteroidia bacterium]